MIPARITRCSLLPQTLPLSARADKPLARLLPKTFVFLGFFGSGGRDRTYDQLINSSMG